MRCPKCGNILADGSTVCFMCGENLAGGQPQQGGVDNANNQPSQSNDIINSTLAESLNSSIGSSAVQSSNSYSGFGNNPPMPQNSDNAFGTGGFAGGAGGFSTGTQPSQPMEQHTTFSQATPSNPNDYKNAEVKILKNEEEDIFDFYAKHKGIIKIVLLTLLVVVVGIVGYNIYLSKVTPEELKPKFQRLYYVVPEGWDAVDERQDSVSYAKSGAKGTDCYVSINLSTGSTGDHVEEFQKQTKDSLKPERDDEGNAKDPLEEFTTQSTETTINSHSWHRMNVFFRKTATSDYNLLKYQTLTAVYKSRYYDIVLRNNSNTNSCGVDLDKFVTSLQFIDDEKK